MEDVPLALQVFRNHSDTNPVCQFNLGVSPAGDGRQDNTGAGNDLVKKSAQHNMFAKFYVAVTDPS